MIDALRSNWRPVIGAVLAPFLAMALTACGGGGSKTNYFEPDGGGGSGSTGGTSGTGGTGGSTGGTSQDSVRIGSLVNGSFTGGQLDVSVATLSAGGTTEVTANLVDQNGDAVTESHTISFTSRCAADGTAALETDVPTIGGQAVAEYVANGCVGDDDIIASVSVDGQTLTAVGTVSVEQEDIGSLEFVNADPDQIALAGTGGDETSRLTFRLVGEAGGAIQDATVNFSLNATTGGLSLTNDTAVTNKAGEASTVVRAGTIATSVRVTATEASTGISTQSSQLVVSTGIPDSDSFSLSVSEHNPDAWDYDGVEVTVTIRAADAFNNPVPPGTAVSVYAEGGSIDPSCTTDETGACEVIWRSQNPRPSNGRVTLLATAIGNESFVDQNGNGRFDTTEAQAWEGQSLDPNGVVRDRGEAFADENENGAHDAGEFFIDFGPGSQPDGIWNPRDMAYNGVLCESDSVPYCSADRSVIVAADQILSMSTSGAGDVVLVDGSTFAAGDSVAIGAKRSLSLVVPDGHGNAMPVGTGVTAEVTQGLTLEGPTSFQVDDGTLPDSFPLTVAQSDDMNPVSGTLSVTITSPSNIVSLFSWPITP